MDGKLYNGDSYQTFGPQDFVENADTYCFDGCKRPASLSIALSIPSYSSGNFRQSTFGLGAYFQGSCQQCLNGKYQDEETQPTCKQCPISKYGSGRGSSGYWQWGNIRCEFCPAGKATDAIHSADNAVDCALCAPGKYRPANSATGCIECPSGKFNPISGQAFCDSCGPGEYSAPGSTSHSSCQGCLAGHYYDGNTCVACDPGYSAALGATSCSPCTFPNYCDHAGCSECSGCAVGSYLTYGTFDFDYGVWTFQACNACPDGKYSSETLTIFIHCQECDAGTYCTAGQQNPCAQGYYQPSAGQNNCQKCNAGYTTRQLRSTIDTACEICDAGYKEDDGICAACDEGTFNDSPHQTSCSICNHPQYCAGQGNRIPLNCPFGSYTTTYAVDDEGTGSYACTECPAGKYLQSFVGTSLEDCQVCPANSYCVGGEHKQSCPENTFSPSGSTGGFAPCTFCAPGTERPDITFPSCTECAAGKYSIGDGDACEPCPQGTYQDTTGQSICTACAYNEYTIETGSDASLNCLTCDATGGFVVNSAKNGCDKCSILYSNLIAVDDGSSQTCQFCSQPHEFVSDNACTTCNPGQHLVKFYKQPDTLTDVQWNDLWTNQDPSDANNIQPIYDSTFNKNNKLDLNLLLSTCASCFPPFYCTSSGAAYELWSISAETNTEDATLKRWRRGETCSSASQNILIVGATSASDCVDTPNMRVEPAFEAAIGGSPSYYECAIGTGVGTFSVQLTANVLPDPADTNYPRCENCVDEQSFSANYDSQACSSCQAENTCYNVEQNIAQYQSFLSAETNFQILVPAQTMQWGELFEVSGQELTIDGKAVQSPIRYNCLRTTGGLCGCVAGTYVMPYNSLYFCAECPAGKFNAGTQGETLQGLFLHSDCLDCNIEFSDITVAAVTFCKCKSHAFNTADMNCDECPAGQIAEYDASGLATCVNCPTSTIRDQGIGALECTTCPEGYDVEPGSNVCSSCAAGHEWNAELQICQACAQFYRRTQYLKNEQDANGTSATCELCPAHECPSDYPVLFSCDKITGDLVCENCYDLCYINSYCSQYFGVDFICEYCDNKRCAATDGKVLKNCGGISAGECLPCDIPGTYGKYNPIYEANYCVYCTTCEPMFKIEFACGGNRDTTCVKCPDGEWSGQNADYCQSCWDYSSFTAPQKYQFDPCCEYNHASGKWWCGELGASNDFLTFIDVGDGVVLTLDPYHLASMNWDCATLCPTGDGNKITTDHTQTPFFSCPTNVEVMINNGIRRTLNFYKNEPDVNCESCERRWSVGDAEDKCQVGQVLENCGGSGVDSAGQCVNCPPGKWHNACLNLCSGLTYNLHHHRVITIELTTSMVAGYAGYSCQVGNETEYHKSCGPFALLYDESYNPQNGNIADTNCFCAIGYVWDVADTDECQACPSSTYGQEIAPTIDMPRQTKCEPCPSNSGHNLQAETSVSSCMCNAGYQSSDGTSNHLCTSCEPGKFKALRNDPSISADTGDNICQACPAGKFQNLAEATQCEDCPVNNFCPTQSAQPQSCAQYYQTDGPGAQSHAECMCLSPFEIIGGVCMPPLTACSPGYYASADTCQLACQDGSKYNTQDCATLPLSHDEALSHSHYSTATSSTATSFEIWQQEANARAKWMHENHVNLEIMPYPSGTAADGSPVHKIAVIILFGFYEFICGMSPEDNKYYIHEHNFALKLTHTYVLDKEWSENCKGPESWSLDRCPDVKYQSFTIDQLGTRNNVSDSWSQYSYWVIDNYVNDDISSTYALNQVSMQWSTALVHCTPLTDLRMMSFSEPTYFEWSVDATYFEATEAWPGRFEQLVRQGNPDYATRSQLFLIGGYTDFAGTNAMSGERADFENIEPLAGNSLFLEECHCSAQNCVQFCRGEIVERDDETFTGDWLQRKIRFVRTPPRQTLPVHRAPGVRTGQNTNHFFDRRRVFLSSQAGMADPCAFYTTTGVTFAPVDGLQYKGNILCFAERVMETDIVNFAGVCSGTSDTWPCSDVSADMDRCLRQATTVLLPSLYKISETKITMYDNSVLHMPYSDTAQQVDITSESNGAIFDFIPIYGFILEIHAASCSENSVQRRMYIPLHWEKSIASFDENCETAQTADTYSASHETVFLTPYNFLNVSSFYWADLQIESKTIYVRMRTWTAYGYSAPSEWQPVLNLYKSCELCPENSESEYDARSASACICKEGYSSQTQNGQTVCLACPSGKFKATVSNSNCINCNSEDNTNYISEIASIEQEACMHVAVTLSPQQLNNFGLSLEIHPIVVCVNWHVARQVSMLTTTTYPNGYLVEYQCVAINPCPSSSDLLQYDTWYHRSMPELQLEHENVLLIDQSMFNHYNMEYARIPDGVVLSTAAPNFTHYKATAQWIPNFNTIRSISGTCLQDLAQSSSACAQDIRNLRDFSTTDHESSYTQGTTQMLKFELQDLYTCSNVAAPGYQLQQTTYKPALQIPCLPKQTHGTYTSSGGVNCVLTCDAGYQIDQQTGLCDRICSETEYPDTTCVGFAAAHVAGSVCTEYPAFFKCYACAHLPGYKSHVFDILQPTICQRTPCPTGYTTPDNNGVCVPCPVHTKQVGSNCEPCTPGEEYQPNPGSTSCVSCPWKSPDATYCDEMGFFAATDIGTINSFLTNPLNNGILPGTALQKHAWCANGWACLPCMPGTFKDNFLADQPCTRCARGKYQNNHAQTVCFDCHASDSIQQNTISDGSIDVQDCKCALGFELVSS